MTDNSRMEKQNYTRISVGKNMARAELRPSSYDEQSNTIEVVFSTGAAVLRFTPAIGLFFEELSMEPEAIDLSRLNAGASVLDTHADYELANVIGVVVPDSARVEGGLGIAKLQISSREELKSLREDIKNGIVRHISVGYSVQEMVQKVREGEDENDTPTFVATRWMPKEISFVPVPADAGSQARSEEERAECKVFINGLPDDSGRTAKTDGADCAVKGNNKELVMSEENKKVTDGGAPADKQEQRADTSVKEAPAKAAKAKPEVDVDAVRSEGVMAERARIKEINETVRKAGLEQSVADKYAESDMSIDQVRAAVIDSLANKDKEQGTSTVRASVTDCAYERRSQYAEEALMHRVGGGDRSKLSDGAKHFRGMSMMEMARSFLEQDGVRTSNMSKFQLAGAALGLENTRGTHSTSDFPDLLANVMNKRLRDAYATAENTFDPIVRRTSASDFKPIQPTQLGEVSKLLVKNEAGEFQYGTIGDSKETYQLATYGRILQVTRETLINDDLSAFDRLAPEFGRAAMELVGDLVWAQITDNPALSDGNNLFSAPHANTFTKDLDASDLGALAEMRKAIRLMKGLDGERRLNLRPTHVAIPAALETELDKILTNNIPDSPANANPFQGLIPIVETRLDDASSTGYYLFAGNGQTDIVELAFLDGQEEPFIESWVDRETDGIKNKVRLDVAAKVIDYRGAAFSDGTVD